ncbi:DUF2516 family protein [Actinocatenispora thailandica]|nr:DUF2516 family protein [Actinocatenispora thailandica]
MMVQFPVPMLGNFAMVVQYYIELLLTVFTLVLELVALVHCAIQRSDAFRAVGTLSKPVWLLLIGGSTLLTLLLGSSPIGLIGLIGLIAASVYLLDVKPGLKDLRSGGLW